MRIKATLLFLVIISFFSCDPSEEPLVEDPIAEDPIVDNTNPEITITGFQEITETYSTFSISASDESDVDISVKLNGVEIASANQKDLDVDINPYSMPIGTTEFTVLVKDKNGNESSKLLSTEIKHWMMTYMLGEIEFRENQKKWAFINDLEGNLLGSKLLVVGENKIYSDEMTANDRIYFSDLSYTDSFGDQTNENLYVSTTILPLAQTRIPTNYFSSPRVESGKLTLRVNYAEVDYTSNRFTVNGPDHGISYYAPTDFYADMEITQYAKQPIYLITNTGYGSTFDGNLENYRYKQFDLDIDEEVSLVVNETEFLTATLGVSINLPEYDASTLYINRSGYENQDKMDTFKVHSIYNYNPSEENAFSVLELPKLDCLSIYRNNINYSKNNINYNKFVSDDDINWEIPNWTLSSSMADGIITVDANNPGIDYYSVSLNKNSTDVSTNNSSRMTWSYQVFAEGEANKSAPILTIPESINEVINNPYFATTNDLEITKTLGVDYVSFTSYEEYINWRIVNGSPNLLSQFYRSVNSSGNP